MTYPSMTCAVVLGRDLCGERTPRPGIDSAPSGSFPSSENIDGQDDLHDLLFERAIKGLDCGFGVGEPFLLGIVEIGTELLKIRPFLRPEPCDCNDGKV